MFYLIASSIVIGLVIAKLLAWLIKQITDAPIEITLSIITPYFAYLAAESAHSSGVLATVVCGMYLGRESSLYFSTRARLQAAAVWETLSFVLNGIVFILIGLQLPYILGEIRNHRLFRLMLIGLLVSAVVIVLRLLWMYPGTWAANWLRRHVQHHDGRVAERGIYSYRWLDRNARRGGAGRRDFPAPVVAGRFSIPAAKYDHFSYVLRDFRDAGVSRLVAAVLDSPPGVGGRGGEESGRGAGALRDDRGRARLSGTSA